MSKTVAVLEKEEKAKAEKKAFEKDKKRAEELMKAFAEFKKEAEEIKLEMESKVKPIQEKYIEMLSPIVASMNEAEVELMDIGKRNTKKFIKNKLALEHGYLLLSIKTVVRTGKDFVMSKFVAKFPQLVTNSFNVAELKKVFTDGDSRPKVMKHDIDLDLIESIQVKVNDKL